MGEKQNGPFQLSFNASLKVDFQGSRVTSDGGLIVCASWMSVIAHNLGNLWRQLVGAMVRRIHALPAPAG